MREIFGFEVVGLTVAWFLATIRDCSKGTSIAFCTHICEVGRVKKRSTVHQYYLRLKMLFNRENGRHMDTNDAKEVLAVKGSVISSSW